MCSAFDRKPSCVRDMLYLPGNFLKPLGSIPPVRPVSSDELASELASPEDDVASDVSVKLMSIGFFLDDNQPVMWRGPMLHRALEQFLSDVHWGHVDVLVVDMPPGTGDVAISLGQLLPRAGTV